MKRINQQRLIDTIEKVNVFIERTTLNEAKVVQQASLLGLKMATTDTHDEETIKDSLTRFNLEMDYLGVGKTPRNFVDITNRFFRKLFHVNKKREKIVQIQEKYQVSAIVETQTKLGDRLIPHLWHHEYLDFIESDIPKLVESKNLLYQEWANYVSQNELFVFVRTRESDDPAKICWQKIDLERIRGLLRFYDWAIVHETIYYVSPTKLQKQGYDSHRTEPQFADDQKVWEVMLELGIGRYPDAPKTRRLVICASNITPRYLG